MRRTVLGAAIGGTIGLLGAVACIEVGVIAFGTDLAGCAFGVLVAASLAAMQGAMAAGIYGGAGRARVAAVGGVVGGLGAFFVLRGATVWIDLSVFGAGPAGQLAAIMLPATQAIVGAVSASLGRRACP
jgi:hypothetical protein